jgi:hypothetical protein
LSSQRGPTPPAALSGDRGERPEESSSSVALRPRHRSLATALCARRAAGTAVPSLVALGKKQGRPMVGLR